MPASRHGLKTFSVYLGLPLCQWNYGSNNKNNITRSFASDLWFCLLVFIRVKCWLSFQICVSSRSQKPFLIVTIFGQVSRCYHIADYKIGDTRRVKKFPFVDWIKFSSEVFQRINFQEWRIINWLKITCRVALKFCESLFLWINDFIVFWRIKVFTTDAV